MEKFGNHFRDLLKTILILVTTFILCLAGHDVFQTQYFIPAFFTLSVYLISVLTHGYLYGVGASLISVLAVNFAFTFPYFKFNFTIPENAFSAVIMLAITITTGALTTKLRKQEKLQRETEKEKMRANLLRAISHDLRTPLTTIYGASSAIIENYDKLTKEQQLELIRGIRQESDWLTHMVENLLSVTRIDGGNLNLVKTSVVLEELIDSVLVKFHKRYPEQEVILDIPDEFVMIPMDPVLIEQVIINLLENSVKHAKGMKHLWLKVSLQKEQVLFEVSDDGNGFENKNKGIGLSVCETIIQAHGGTFLIDSRKVGKVSVSFTLKKEEESDGE